MSHSHLTASKAPLPSGRPFLDPSGPRYDRPCDQYGPPTALFDHAFAVLQYGLEHLEGLTPDGTTTIPHAYNLVSYSADFFGEEDLKKLILRPTLEALLPRENTWEGSMADGAAKPDGGFFEGPFVYLIVQLENEPEVPLEYSTASFTSPRFGGPYRNSPIHKEWDNVRKTVPIRGSKREQI